LPQAGGLLALDVKDDPKNKDVIAKNQDEIKNLLDKYKDKIIGPFPRNITISWLGQTKGDSAIVSQVPKP
jgi:hypothetical protein